jgi:hypothetical protein
MIEQLEHYSSGSYCVSQLPCQFGGVGRLLALRTSKGLLQCFHRRQAMAPPSGDLLVARRVGPEGILPRALWQITETLAPRPGAVLALDQACDARVALS